LACLTARQAVVVVDAVFFLTLPVVAVLLRAQLVGEIAGYGAALGSKNG
jgi:hypothetical protein